MSTAAQLLHATEAFQLGTPLLHVLAVYWTWPRSKSCSGGSHSPPRVLHALTFPLAGGPRTFVFQVLSWCHLAISILLAIPPFYFAPSSPHLDLFMSLAAFSAVVAILFMAKSILLFDPAAADAAQGHWWRRLARGRAAIEWDVSRLPSQLAAFYIVVGLGLLWSALGAGLLAAAAQGGHSPALRAAYYTFAAACFTVAAFTTHGLGGHLRHRASPPPMPPAALPTRPRHRHSRTSAGSAAARGVSPVSLPRRRHTLSELPPRLPETWTLNEEDEEGYGDYSTSKGGSLASRAAQWRFFQPFRGGPIFVATQAAGWLLYSAALVGALWGASATTWGLAHSLRAWAVAAGATGIAAELAIAASLLAYNAQGLPFSVPPKFLKPSSIRSAASSAAIVTTLYLQVHVVVAAVAITFFAFPALQAATLWGGGLAVYYSITGFGAEVTGHREWPAFQDWVGRESQRVLPHLLGSFEVRAASGAAFSSSKKYVFGYAPHGLFPIGAAYLPCTPAFRKIVGRSIRPATLTASVVFLLPFLRDLLLWTGARVVSRAAFVRALRDKGAVIIVPGGQAELVEAHKAARRKDPRLVVCTRHKGFARIAASEGASLVPVAVLGEVTSLRNAIVLPRLQRFTYKVLGFPVPFLMAGRAGVLPLPSKTGLRFVVGRPIEPPAPGPDGVVEEAAVEAFHAEFYDQLAQLYEEHRGDFPGYEDMALERADR